MRCQRCHGCMISDHFMDILNVSGEMDFKGWRCLNCGDITDSVIVHHQEVAARAPAKSRRRWWGITLMASCIPVCGEAGGKIRGSGCV
jgi:hypothetical protein